MRQRPTNTFRRPDLDPAPGVSRRESKVGVRWVGRMLREVGAFVVDDSGQAATEYVLIIAMISIPIYALLKTLFIKFLGGFIRALVQAFTRG